MPLASYDFGAGNAPVFIAFAKAEGGWTNTVGLEVNYNTTSPGESFTLTVIHEAEGRVVASEKHANLSTDYSSPRFAPTFVSPTWLRGLALDAMFDAERADEHHRPAPLLTPGLPPVPVTLIMG